MDLSQVHKSARDERQSVGSIAVEIIAGKPAARILSTGKV